MESTKVALAIFAGTGATLAVAWLLVSPLILFALHIESKRRDQAREVTRRHGVSLDDLDGVDTTRWLDRNGRNGGTL